jgi:uncharacterized protein GlcG (DUF336 family)
MRASLRPAGLAFFALLLASCAARAADCPANYDKLQKALKGSVKPSGGPSNGGFDNNEWGVLVTRDGAICAVAMSGASPDDEWLASRGIAAEKAFTALGVSLKGFAVSTANLYAGSQPGGYLYGLLSRNPVKQDLLYEGDPSKYGSSSDPLVGKHLGGVVTFGGGLALYDSNKNFIGALGVSGDTSCADHNVAWRVREALGLDKVPDGVSPDHNDEIIYDVTPNMPSLSGYGHPQCKGHSAEIAVQIHASFIPRWARVSQ